MPPWLLWGQALPLYVCRAGGGGYRDPAAIPEGRWLPPQTWLCGPGSRQPPQSSAPWDQGPRNLPKTADFRAGRAGARRNSPHSCDCATGQPLPAPRCHKDPPSRWESPGHAGQAPGSQPLRGQPYLALLWGWGSLSPDLGCAPLSSASPREGGVPAREQEPTLKSSSPGCLPLPAKVGVLPSPPDHSEVGLGLPSALTGPPAPSWWGEAPGRALGAEGSAE